MSKYIDELCVCLVMMMLCVVALLVLNWQQMQHNKRVEKIFNEYEMKMDSLHSK